jgi:hypothetical protein
MKVSDLAIASKLLDKINERELWITAVRTGALEINFGGYAFTVAQATQDDLRQRILDQLLSEVEQLRAQAEALGVEL